MIGDLFQRGLNVFIERWGKVESRQILFTKAIGDIWHFVKKEKEIFFSHRFCQLRISEVCLLNFTLVSCSMQTLSIAFFSTVCQIFSRSFLLMLNLWPNTPKLSFHNIHNIVSATYCNLFNTKSYVYDWMHQESSFGISIFTHTFMRLKLKINYAFFHYDISQPGIPAFLCFSYTFITLIQQH